MRYFFVSYGTTWKDGVVGFANETVTCSNGFPKKKELELYTSTQYKSPCVILNIQELSEQDYLDFTKGEKGTTNA